MAIDVVLNLDLGSWGISPFQWVHFSDEIMLNWNNFNITSISWFLVGDDGAEMPLAVTKGVWFVIGRAAGLKYTDSWCIDNGNGVIADQGTDTAPEGMGVITMSNPETVNSFNLLIGSTQAKLRAYITPADTTKNITIDYPKFRRNDGRNPNLVWESGQVHNLLYADHAGVRFGNYWWYLYIAGFLPQPIVVGKGRQTSVLDGLANERVWLRGIDKESGLAAEIGTLYKNDEASSFDDVSSGTYWCALPNPTWSTVNFAAITGYSEVPPLCLCPRRARDSANNYAETGVFQLEVWSWIDNTQKYIAPGTTPLHLHSPGGAAWTSIDAGYVNGWTVTEHAHVVDNSEDLNYEMRYNSNLYGKARPWHGYKFDPKDLGLTTKNPFNWNDSNDWFYRSDALSDGTIRIQRSRFTAPPFESSSIGTTDTIATRPRIFRDYFTQTLYVIFQLENPVGTTQVYTVKSNDDGETWSAKVAAFTGNGYYPTGNATEDGIVILACLKYNSGSSGPGKIAVRVQQGGEAAFGTEFFIKGVGGTDIVFADDTFHIFPAHDGGRGWILSAKMDGDTAPSEWVSTDDLDTWDKVL